jgi:serine/threonine protein kinase/Tol biopolymer transport system component
MHKERWQVIDSTYHAALAREGEARSAFLDEACANDEELRIEVEALINHDRQGSSFLESPALEVAARKIGNDSCGQEQSETSKSLSALQQIGPYTILALLGKGGMGEVYRARDSKLKRDVAIKVLPDGFSRDAERLSRFRREAEVLASLNHPHIAAIYDLARFGELQFLVLELVEGETLADRLSRGPVPIDEALQFGKQITEALEAAHEKGIIHRDLKPANIKITTQGNVKVLDFGLAKVLDDEAARSSNMPTRATVTTLGSFLGTAAYMSPEQARSENADKSSDVWAFGCMLYELLTGCRVFEGESVGEILGEVLKTEPEWRRLPADTPDGIRRLLRRCLQKDQKRRFRDIRDARLEIEDILSTPPESQPAEQLFRGRWQRPVLASGLALVTLIAAVTGVRTFRTFPAEPERRFEISMPSTWDAIRNESVLAAISPDGLKIVFAATVGGQSQLWLRSLDSVSARPLAGTDRAEMPFWSPDNRSVGFFADAELKRVDLDGGSLQTLAHAEAGAGGAWSRGGTIIFSANPGRPILQVPAKGAEPTAVTPFQAPQQASQSFPQFLPDSRHFLYFVTGSRETSGVYIGQTDGLTSHRLLDADAPAVYTSTGHLLFMRQGTLWAQAFNAERLELSGNTFPVAEHLGRWAALSASAAGPIVYRIPPAGGGQQQLVWFDRFGNETGKVAYPNTGGLGASLSRDDGAIAMFKYADGNMDIWLFEIERRVWNRITFDSADDIYPVWSPNGRSLAFGSNRVEGSKGGIQNLYRKLVGGAPGSEELLLESPQIKFATDWSANGSFLLYDSVDQKKGGSDIWALPLEGERKAFEVVHTIFQEQAGQFSPDGKWIAYQSDKEGRFQIYVQAFPGPADSVLFSTNGGTQVRWNPNGKELFYIAPDGRLMTVPIRIAANGQTVVPSTATALFATNLRPFKRQEYMVSSDGRSFVMNSVLEPTGASPVTVILNWKPKP